MKEINNKNRLRQLHELRNKAIAISLAAATSLSTAGCSNPSKVESKNNLEYSQETSSMSTMDTILSKDVGPNGGENISYTYLNPIKKDNVVVYWIDEDTLYIKTDDNEQKMSVVEASKSFSDNEKVKREIYDLVKTKMEKKDFEDINNRNINSSSKNDKNNKGKNFSLVCWNGYDELHVKTQDYDGYLSVEDAKKMFANDKEVIIEINNLVESRPNWKGYSDYNFDEAILEYSSDYNNIIKR